MRKLLFLIVTACSAAKPPVAAPPPPTSVPVVAAAATPAAPVHERFDEKIRQDFFDGLRGDTAALERAMKLCEDTLAREPQHPEAMVWHGAGLLARSAHAFRGGNTGDGMQLYQRGLAEMDHAVDLAPNDVGVRIPRGAVLLAMAPYVPEPEKTRLLHRGVDDYRTTLAVQDKYFGRLTLHAREQLLYGLTDGYANLGDLDDARAVYARMQKDAVGSALLDRAKLRAEGQAVAGQAPCEQCHSR